MFFDDWHGWIITKKIGKNFFSNKKWKNMSLWVESHISRKLENNRQYIVHIFEVKLRYVVWELRKKMQFQQCKQNVFLINFPKRMEKRAYDGIRLREIYNLVSVPFANFCLAQILNPNPSKARLTLLFGKFWNMS